MSEEIEEVKKVLTPSELLETNLKIIDETTESNFISEQIRVGEMPSWLREFKDELGNENFSIYNTAGEIPAYSSDDVNKGLDDIVSKLSLNGTDITIMIGVGFGYLLKNILEKKHKDHIIILIEPVKYLLRKTLSIYDFSEQIKDHSLILALDKKEDITNIFQVLESVRVNESYNIVIEKYVNSRLEDYASMADHAMANLNQLRCNRATVMSIGEILADNDIQNLPFVLPHRGVIEFKDFYKDKPAIVVSTGPSLVKNIHLLKGIQDKVIIIAVAQALRPLMAYDIIPDFITTVDFGETNMGHLKGIMDSEVPLVCLNRTYANLIKSYKGPKIIVSTPMQGFEKTAAGILNDKGTLDQGGSVAHMSLSLADHLGCNPIMIIGQDLALSEDRSHIPLADVAGEIEIKDSQILWKVKDPRSKLSGNNISHSMGELVYTNGYFGDTVKTNIGLASFITAFETLVEKYKDKKIFNCTEGGADIKKTLKSSLKKCIAEYCTNIIDKEKIRPLLSEADNKDELIDQVIPLLRKDIDNLKLISNRCSQGIFSANRMTEIINSKKNKHKKSKSLNYWSKKNHEESDAAFKATLENPLVSVAIYNASVKIQSHKVNLKIEKDKPLIEQKEVLEIRIKRNIFILTSAKKASDNLKKAYNDTLELLNKYSKTKDGNLFKDLNMEEIHLKDSEDYFKTGNYAHPYVSALKILKNDPTNEEALKVKAKAIELREAKIKEVTEKENQGMGTDRILDYNKLLDCSRESGRNKDFDNALWCLEQANEMNPHQEVVLWGLATTCERLKRYAEAIGYYQQLLDKHPNHKYNFEYGDLLIKNNQVQEGLVYITKAIQESSAYNHYFKNIGNFYYSIQMYKEAIEAYEQYINFFPLDKEVYSKLITCCQANNVNDHEDFERMSKYMAKLEEVSK